MLMSEHVETAQKFLDDADREYAAGDILQASEKLWKAASHVVYYAGCCGYLHWIEDGASVVALVDSWFNFCFVDVCLRMHTRGGSDA